MFSEIDYNEAKLENKTLQDELIRIRSTDVTDEELATLSIKVLDYNRWLVQEKLKNTYWWNAPYVDKRFKDLPMVK
jgi:hypothetical protein